MTRLWSGSGSSVLTSLVGALAVTTPAAAQEGIVHVTVIERARTQPIDGARIALEGTRFTGQTDGRGEIAFANVPAGAYTVLVSAMGYRNTAQTVTVPPGGTARVSFELGLSPVTLDEIVVTGTGGAVERKKLGTTVGTVDVTNVTDVAAVGDFGSLMSARIPGVRSIGTTGGVGDSKDLRIRGVGSFGLRQRPVVYIDGVRIDTDTFSSGTQTDGNGTACCFFSGGAGFDRLNDLNPDDIERVEVIRGAAAGTLYGTEATNGVIQIFTKRGRSNSRPRWTAAYSAGFNRLRANFDTKLHPRFIGRDSTNIYARDANDLIENGLIQRGDVTVQGGGESVTYFASTGLSYEEGSLQPNDMLRGNLRLNLNWIASDRWSFGLQSAFVKNRVQLLQSGNNWTALYGNATAGDPFKATAERPYGERFVAIADIREMQSEVFTNRWTGGVTVNFRPTASFGHRLTLGLDQVGERRERLHPYGRPYIYVGTDAERSIGFRNFSSWTLDYLGTLTLDVGSSAQSDFSFGAQGFWETDHTSTAVGEGYAGAGVTTVQGGAVTSGHETFREEINVGLFAQNRLSVRDKLFLTAGARLDGNSAFGRRFGLQFYPKGEVSYLVTDRGVGTISSARLRAAVGRSGLAPRPFDHFRTFAPFPVLEGEAGVQPDNPGNLDLEPEKTTEVEGGFDVGLFDDRVSIEATAYYARTVDALVPVELPPSLGFPDEQLRNIGALENRGWEVSLDAVLVEGDNLRWSTGLNMDGNHNEITDLGPFVQDCNAARTSCKLGNLRTGKAVQAIYRREVTGFAVDSLGRPRHTVSDTAVYRGDPLPHWTGSMTHLFEFGQFRVYGMVTWEKGARFRGDRGIRIENRTSDEYLQLLDSIGVDSITGVPIWKPTFQADSLVDFHSKNGRLEKRDHIRLREVSVSYRLPSSLSSTLGLGQTVVTLSGQNLMWWDDCHCTDPSLDYRGGNAAVASFSGLFATPQPRTFVFSVRTTFE